MEAELQATKSSFWVRQPTSFTLLTSSGSRSARRHGGTAVSAVAPQQEGPGFEIRTFLSSHNPKTSKKKVG